MNNYIIAGFLLLSLVSCNSNSDPASVKIGDQVWMTENLSTNKFRNGDDIPEARTREEWIRMCDAGEPAWINPVNNREFSNKYGKFYNWFAVNDPRGIAPGGWHVPSDEEWNELTDFLGGESLAAYSLRSTGSDQSNTRFSGLPAGGCKNDGSYINFGSRGYWWTSTPISEEFAWVRQLDYIQFTVSSLAMDKRFGTTVRCIKD